MGGSQLHHQIGGDQEQDLDACHHGAIGKRLRQLALAHAAGPQEYDVLRPFDEVQGRQFLNRGGAWRTAGEDKVKVQDGTFDMVTQSTQRLAKEISFFIET